MQTPLESHKPMASQIKGKQTCAMFDDRSLLGFKSMVAPTSETASQGYPCPYNTPIPRDVQQLLGRIHASTSLAPSLCDIIRKGLEHKEIQGEVADTYLKTFHL